MNDKTTQGVAKKMWDDLDFSSEESVNAEEATFDMIPRAEADARVAAAYLDALNCLDGVDSEEDGLGVVWGDFSELATVLSNRTPDDASAAFNQIISDAVNEATKLTVPIAALDKMLDEARREGYLEGWRFAYR